jgi:hypothetical protein
MCVYYNMRISGAFHFESEEALAFAFAVEFLPLNVLCN